MSHWIVVALAFGVGIWNVVVTLQNQPPLQYEHYMENAGYRALMEEIARQAERIAILEARLLVVEDENSELRKTINHRR